MRLRNTIVKYAGDPYHGATICNHKDGIFRIYLEPLDGTTFCQNRGDGIPIHHYNQDSSELMVLLDTWVESPDNTMIRKMMNSPKFNNFRPFPLGMYNADGTVYYVERHPTRKTEQGLQSNMLIGTCLPTAAKLGPRDFNVFAPQFADMIKGEYPTTEQAYEIVKSNLYKNDAVAFNREMAFISGPVSLVFLAYRHDIVGLVAGKTVTLGKEFQHLTEVINESNAFNEVKYA